MAGIAGDGLARIDSLRRRGLISATAYEALLAERRPETYPASKTLRLQPLALLMALVGGVLGVLGAVSQGIQTIGFGGPFVAAPIVEGA